jgi:hypothetical protein
VIACLPQAGTLQMIANKSKPVSLYSPLITHFIISRATTQNTLPTKLFFVY